MKHLGDDTVASPRRRGDTVLYRRVSPLLCPTDGLLPAIFRVISCSLARVLASGYYRDPCVTTIKY